MTPVKKGCAIAASVVIGLAALLYWPYRLETIVGIVSRNEAKCVVEAINHSGWAEHSIAPGISAESVKYPLQLFVFITDCPGVPDGRPFAAELIDPSGKVVARGLACSDAPTKDYPCRLEAPPIASLRGADRYIVRVVPARGAAPKDAVLRIESSAEWRSATFDALMSV